MNLSLRQFSRDNRWFFLGLGLSLLLAFWGMAAYDKGQILIWLSEYRSVWKNYYFRYATLLGEEYLYLALGIFFLFRNNARALGIASLGAGSMLLSAALKAYFARPRPLTYFTEVLGQPDLISLVPQVEVNTSWTSSFPSGHTLAAFALYGFMAFNSKHQGFKLFYLALGLTVALSRLYLVQHFLEDVAAGAIAGTILAFGVYTWQLRWAQTNWGQQNLSGVFRARGL